MTQHFFISTQATYESIEYALCSNISSVMSIIDQRTLSKMQASSLLMQKLNELLADHMLTWSHIEKLVVNCGPAPFTTLRALIATVNGISFATHIPLVGIDGLKAFAFENSDAPISIVLLNAFTGDVYFAINDHDKLTSYGWQNGITLLQTIKATYSDNDGDKITFKGNGVDQLRSIIKELFEDRAMILSPNPSMASLATITNYHKAELAEQETNTENSFHLSPLYLKTIEYKPSM